MISADFASNRHSRHADCSHVSTGMKIAQIAPLAESVPPRLSGGTERVVFYLTEELVRLGHDVTLFAGGDPVEGVRNRAREFDVLHFHLEHLHLPLLRRLARKTITTLYGRLDLPDLLPLYRDFDDMPLVSISDAQRRPLSEANWVATVHHGLPEPVCPYNPAPRGQYLAFIGRVSPEMGLDRAIEIARRAGVRLRIAAKVERADEGYWRSRIAPLVSDPLIEFAGEVSEEDKPALLGNATALLFPIDCPEPFGLAMIEAMSCGTPVIAWPHGSVPEIVDEGVTGLLVSSIDQAVAAVHDVAGLSRAQVRRRFEERFSAARMARDYLAVYRSPGTKKKLEVML
jgi:glycosyltransferase involved in cell wall biosynthesis